MSVIKRLNVELETVTPLFLGGADPRGEPELREPSFRGALRYWLRAALGGVYGDDAAGLAKVRQVEAIVFGSTEEKKGGASAIAVRIPGKRRLPTTPYSELAKYPGLAYLFFAARGTRREPERKGAVGRFTLELSVRPGVGEPEGALRRAYAALWLLTHLGGVGTRSRRGAGALQAIKVQDESWVLQNPPLSIQATTPEDLARELKEGLKDIRSVLGDGIPSVRVQQPSAFDVLHPGVCRIWVISKSYGRKWEHALSEVGHTLQGFRNRRPDDYKVIKGAIVNEAPLAKPVGRAAFGLPIPFYYRSLGGLTATLEAKDHDRRASPLWIRVVKLANDQHAIVLVWFQSKFLPKGQLKLKWKDKKRRQIIVSGNVPRSTLLKMFLEDTDPVKHSSLKDKGLSLLEVW